MLKRKIIKIDESKCDGCGLCMPNCPEGAIQIIDAKARLVSDLFCDGLGACLGYCPKDAITIEEREAQEYDEKAVMRNIVKQGKNVIVAHLKHLKAHNAKVYFQEALEYLKEKGISNPLAEDKSDGLHLNNFGSCPGSRVMDLGDKIQTKNMDNPVIESRLANWPVQLKLIPPQAPYLENAEILITADCVPFAYSSFHQDLLKDKVLLIGCPKLDNVAEYKEKITQILKHNNVKSIAYAHMEVPCCFGLLNIIQEAIYDSGKKVGLEEIVIGIKGERLK